MSKYPNSYCKSCHSFSMKHSNEICAKRLEDDSRCKAALFGIPDNGLETCPVCAGTGNEGSNKCTACNGYGFELKD